MHWLDSVVFPEPFWVDVRGDRKASEPLELEVWRELRFTHPLGRIAGKVVASCPGTGEVVMTTRTGAAVVQLTWLGRKVDDGRPEWVEVGSADELLGELRSRPRMHWLDSLEFPARGWTDLRNDPERAAGLERELRVELGRSDPRDGALLEVVASAWPKDDVVVKTRRGAAIVHLTWRGRKERAGWPDWGDLTRAELEAELQAVAADYDDDWE